MLLGRLGDEKDRPGKIGLQPGEDRRDTEHDRRVDIVAAGVHRAVFLAVADGFLFGGEGEARVFDDRESVHVGPHPDNGAGLSSAKDADDPMAADARPDLEAELRERVGHEGRRPRLLEREFGVLVDVAADRDEPGRDLLDENCDLLVEAWSLRRDGWKGDDHNRNREHRGDEETMSAHRDSPTRH